jgi:hypothetical protein
MVVALSSIGAIGAAQASAACPNEAVRAEQGSTSLPDCRAYEMVSPLDKDGYGIFPELGQASVNSSGVAYSSFGAFSNAQGSGAVNMYVASRGAESWKTKNVSPRMGPFFSLNIPTYFGFSPDLSKLVLQARTPPQQPGPTAPDKTANLFIRDNTTDLYRVLTSEPAPPDPFGFGAQSLFGAASADYSRAFFTSLSPYLPGATAGVENIYEAAEGQPLSLFMGDADLGAGAKDNTQNAVSADGSRIYYTTPSAPDLAPVGQLFLRDGATTIHVSAPQRPVNGPDPDGTQPAYFRGASRDGSVVFFTSPEKLTDDSTAAAGSPELYRYNVESGELSDLTVAGPGGAGVLGTSWVSDVGDRIYFAATAALAPGATAGEPNLYLWSDAGGAPEISFIATALPGEGAAWSAPEDAKPTTRVTHDGRYFAFETAAPVPGSDSAGFNQVYLYDAEADDLVCASCDPQGSPATADAFLQRSQRGFNIPRASVSRNLSDDGALLFETEQSLLERDSNGRVDVYAFDYASDGLALISTGASAFDSSFANADPAGVNVFFTTSQRLSEWDVDDLPDLYAARIEGGLPGPPEGPPPCTGEGCRSERPTAPAPSAPASAALSGPQNLASDRGCRALDRRANAAAQRAEKLAARSDRAAGAPARALRKQALKQRKRAQRLAKRARRCLAALEGSAR